jgi:hypothetical protein
MRKIVLIVCLLLLSFYIKSQTHIAENSNISGVWSKEKSPYIIDGNVTIPKGETLIINAGVEVRLKASKNKRKVGTILVYGTIEALGIKEFPILFTKTNNKGDWGSVYLVESENSIFEYCNFEYSGGHMNAEGILSTSAKGVLSLEKSNPRLSNIKISNSFIGIYCISESSPIISKCIIESCYIAIELFKNSNVILTNSVISGSGQGINSHNSNSIIHNCNILNNKHSGIIYDNGSKIEVNRSIFWGNGVAFTKYRYDPVYQSIIQPEIEIDKPKEKTMRLKTQNIIGIPPNDVDFIEKLRFDITSNTIFKVSGKEIIIGSQIKDKTNIKSQNIISTNVNSEVTERRTLIEKPYVDTFIPLTDKKSNYKFALIIGNEDYTKYQTNLTNEVNVDFAINDAEIFAKYCKNVLGVPEENIFLLKNAIGTEIKREVNKISKMMMYSQGKAEVIFYYAGHGIPHETTKESYIMPVDVSAQNIEDGVKLSWLYSKLTEYNSKYVLVFLDACFTGGARNQGLLAARGVKIKPKEDIINGNCVAFTSSSDIQSSLPYKEKQHGMFTYHLLKKLQETKGNITLGELSDYLYENVALSSLKVNNKEQTPKTLVSPSLQENWKQIKLIE